MQQFTVTTNDAGQRMDRFVKKLLPNGALSLIYKMNRKNRIKVNGSKVPIEHRLEVGDEISLYLPDEEFLVLRRTEAPIKPGQRRDPLNPKDIVYEDAHLLLVNKNPGINVHPGDHKTSENSLIEQVQDYLGNKLVSLTFRPALVHRIDRNTSGLIMIAKTKPSLDHMMEALQAHKIEKKYLAVCIGTPKEAQGTIRAPLTRIENAKNENKVVVDPEGQKAVTHYKVLETSPDGKYSLVECRLETGRMHQIRVHMASIGTPVLGDIAYGDKTENLDASKKFGVKRQFLHASEVSFVHPKKGVPVRFRARLKQDMEEFLRATSFARSESCTAPAQSD